MLKKIVEWFKTPPKEEVVIPARGGIYLMNKYDPFCNTKVTILDVKPNKYGVIWVQYYVSNPNITHSTELKYFLELYTKE